LDEQMLKRMKHPNHGFHYAYDSHEEARMRAAGWVDDAAEEVTTAPEKPAEPASDSAETLRAALEKAGIEYDKRWGVAKLTQALKGEQ
jgi:hypothetical protein